MYKIVYRIKGLTKEFESGDFGDITDKLLELKMKHHLWFVRGMHEEKENRTVFFDSDLLSKRSEVMISKNDEPLCARGSQFLCISYILCFLG